MPEPTTSIVSAVVSAASAVTLALLGVDYYSLFWGMVGALLALYQAKRIGRFRALIGVVLSTLLGAALGTGAVDFWGSTSRPILIVISAVSGFGAQLIMSALLRNFIHQIDRVGGNRQIGGQ